MQFRRLTEKHPFLLTAALLAGMFLQAEGALAAGLGALTVRSHLGDRFLGEVTLVEHTGPTNSEAGCFRLERSDEGDSGIPFLTHGRVRLERQNGQSKLVIISDQLINEPVLQIKLRVGCGTELVRSYTALIDPAMPAQAARPLLVPSPSRAEKNRQAESENPPPTSSAYPSSWQTTGSESARSIAKTLFPRQPSSQRRFLTALAAENPNIEFGSNGEAPLDKGIPLSIPDTRRRATRVAANTSTDMPTAAPRPAAKSPLGREKKAETGVSGRMSDRLLISGDGNESFAGSELPLRLSTELNTRVSRRVSENQRAMLRMEYQLLNTLYAQASAQLALADQIRSLEANLEGMRTAYDTAARDTETAPSAPANPSNSDTAPVQTAKAVPQAQKHGATPAPTPGADPTIDAWWLELLAIIASVGILAVVFLRRSKRPLAAPKAGLDNDQPPVSATIDTSQRPALLTENKPPLIEEPFEQTVVASPPPAPSAPTAPPGTIEFEDFHLPLKQLDIEVDESGDYTTTLELADIMVAFGRIKGATQTLEEYLEHSPRAALAPWLKLLELYRSNDMREEFDMHSEKLRSHFNIAPLNWDEAATCFKDTLAPDTETDSSIDALLQKLPAISDLPRIADGIRESWGTPEGFSFIKTLLNDTRDGTRTGFPMQMARELLFLKKVLKIQLEQTP